MNKEVNLFSQFSRLGIPDSKQESIGKHLSLAEHYVCPKDPGIEMGMKWMWNSLNEYMDSEDARVLYGVIDRNKPSGEVDYLEEGYDSCQSHRKLAKVVSEAILIGGVVHEARMLGWVLDLDEAKDKIDSSLDIEDGELDKLVKIAAEYGSAQDFLFPGVTPSSDTTPGLEFYAYETLKGTPMTSVRSVTGLGGLRYDKDWNYVTDLGTFVNLKIEEDKRYYPGLPLFYYLKKMDLSEFPIMNSIMKNKPDVYRGMLWLSKSLKEIESESYQGVSVLCSAYLPFWNEMKKYTHDSNSAGGSIEFSDAFHSPSYEFSVLYNLVSKMVGNASVSELDSQQLSALKKKLSYMWSFNSSIHLPWTAELAGLSNNLIGQITNIKGDHCIRYGVGYEGKSVEVREYHFGKDRGFPYGIAGKVTYGLRTYPESDKLVGVVNSLPLTANNKLLKETKEKGYLKAAIEYLKSL